MSQKDLQEAQLALIHLADARCSGSSLPPQQMIMGTQKMAAGKNMECRRVPDANNTSETTIQIIQSAKKSWKVGSAFWHGSSSLPSEAKNVAEAPPLAPPAPPNAPLNGGYGGPVPPVESQVKLAASGATNFRRKQINMALTWHIVLQCFTVFYM